MIEEKDVVRLANLARIPLHKNDAQKLVHDFENILDYFEQLKEVSTSSIAPIAGGTLLSNEVRNDEKKINTLLSEKAIGIFPQAEDGFLVVPPVFE